MGFHRVTDTTGEPINWKITHFANISGSEEFIAQLVIWKCLSSWMHR
jgi:hypothetical protein